MQTVFGVFLLAWLLFRHWAHAEKMHLRRHWPWALGLKLLSGLGVAALYHHFYQSGDTLAYFSDACKIRAYAWEHPLEWLQFMLDPKQIAHPDMQLALGTERAVFMDKIAGLVCLATGENHWLMAIYCSLFAFAGLWALGNTLVRWLPTARWAAAIAFFYWPSTVFWSSGLLKESILMGCMGFAVAHLLQWLYLKDKHTVAQWLWQLLALWVIFEMKYYYFAALLLAFLALWLAERFMDSFKAWQQIGLLLLLAAVLLCAVQFVHPNLNFDLIAYSTHRNHVLMAQQTEQQANLIVLPQLDGSWQGLVASMPKAFAEGLLRPYLWEEGHWLKRLAAIEASFALLLLLFALMQMRLPAPRFRLPLLVLLGYLLLFFVLMPIVSPNLGNLIRYRVGYWHFYIFLLLLNFCDKRLFFNRL